MPKKHKGLNFVLGDEGALTAFAALQAAVAGVPEKKNGRAEARS